MMHPDDLVSARGTPGTGTHRFLERPLVLTGPVRSGSTMLRLMLGSHPRIAFQSEMDYVFQLLNDPAAWPGPDFFRDELATHPFFIQSGFSPAPGLGPRELIDDVVRQFRDRADKPLVGLTVHGFPERTLRVWPDARFIHLLRDGRDVGRSIIQMGWAGNMYQSVGKWIDAERRWAELSRTVPADRRIVVRYRDLVRGPEKVLTGVCEFIGVPYDRAMLAYSEQSSYGPPSAALADQWRTKLSERELRQAESRIGDMLVERGYELSGLPPLKITPWRHLLYRADAWIRVKRFERRRFGVPFVVTRDVLRRAGTPSLRRAHRRWWYSIEKHYLK